MAKDTTFNEGELVIFGLLAVGLWIFSRGGITQAAAAAGEAAVRGVVNAAGGMATGAVSGIGQTVGLPGTSELTDDPYVSRWIAEHPAGGRMAASMYSTSSAFINSFTVEKGFPPPVGSPLYRMFPPSNDPNTVDMATGRPVDYANAPGYSANDPGQWGIGL